MQKKNDQTYMASTSESLRKGSPQNVMQLMMVLDAVAKLTERDGCTQGWLGYTISQITAHLRENRRCAREGSWSIPLLTEVPQFVQQCVTSGQLKEHCGRYHLAEEENLNLPRTFSKL